MPEWLVQVVCNALLSGLISGTVVSLVKAKMEHFYQKKHEDEKKTEAQKEKQEMREKELREKEISSLKNELLAVKGKVNQISEKVSYVKESIAVVIAKQDAGDDRITEVSEMVKNIVSQNYGKVKVIR